MNGIIVVDKPPLFTSHDIVNFIRRKFKIKKVGHAGTLDPLATGVLVILLGAFTKKSIEFTNTDKEYTGTLLLGAETDTGDAQGKVIFKQETYNFNQDDIRNVFLEFIGEINQIPPMVSSLKYKGQPLYKLARKGIVVERQPRKILINSLEIIKMGLPEVEFKVNCSKGVYIRQLAVDIGRRIGCGAHLSQLRRTRSGRFSLSQSLSWEQLQELDNLDLFLCR